MADGLEVKAGQRFRSAVCDTEVIVVKPAPGAIDLRCGGHPMVAADADRPDGLAATAPFDTGTPIGKRFADADTGLELLCTKGGTGTLSIGDTAIPLKDAKPLPASD